MKKMIILFTFLIYFVYIFSISINEQFNRPTFGFESISENNLSFPNEETYNLCRFNNMHIINQNGLELDTIQLVSFEDQNLIFNASLNGQNFRFHVGILNYQIILRKYNENDELISESNIGNYEPSEQIQYTKHRIYTIDNEKYLAYSYRMIINHEQSNEEIVRENDYTILVKISNDIEIIQTLLHCQGLYQFNNDHFVGIGSSRITSESHHNESIRRITFKILPEFQIISNEIWTGNKEDLGNQQIGDGRTDLIFEANNENYFITYKDWTDDSNKFIVFRDHNVEEMQFTIFEQITSIISYNNELGEFLLTIIENDDTKTMNIYDRTNMMLLDNINIDFDYQHLQTNNNKDRLFRVHQNLLSLYTIGDQDTNLKSIETSKTWMRVFPNPLSSNTTRALTTILFTLPEDAKTEISIFNVKGQLVLRNKLGYLREGDHSEIIHMRGHASGVYYVNLRSNGIELCTKKFVLVK